MNLVHVPRPPGISPGRLLILLLSPVLLVCELARPQSHALRFEHLRNEAGLNSRSIYTILLDRQGFLCFGTDNGLSRYDGTRFTTVVSPFNDDLGSGQNLVYDCFEAPDGILWCATPGGGLLRYDPIRDTLSRFTVRSAGLSSNSAYAVCEDGCGTLWAGTNGGLDTLDPASGTFRHVTRTTEGTVHPFDIKVTAIREWPPGSGHVWIGTWGEGLYRYRRDRRDWTRWTGNTRDTSLAKGGFVRTVFQTRQKSIWFGTELGGLFRIDPVTEALSTLPFSGTGPEAPGAIKDINEIPEGLLLISTLSTGLYLVDPSTGAARQWTADPHDPQSISHNDVRCTLVGPSGTIWVATRDGIDKANPVRGLFTLYQHDPGRHDGLSDNMVYGMCEDAGGTLWIATGRGGLDLFHRRSGRWRHFTHQTDRQGDLATDQLSSVYEDRSGIVWVGGRGGWLHRYQASSGRFDRWLIARMPFDPPGTTISSIMQDKNGGYWLGTTQGMMRFDPRSGDAAPVGDLIPAARKIKGPVAQIIQDRNGNLWIASLASGLHMLSLHAAACSTFTDGPADPSSFRHTSVSSLLEDEQGNLWIGTAGGGVHRRDPTLGTFTEFTRHDGLSNDMIYMLIEDQRGRIWATTGRGLSVFDPATGRWSTFDASDGLPAEEFNSGGAVRCSDGTLCFGGVNGITTIRPDTLYPNTHVPPVRLTALSIGGRPYVSGIGIPYLTSATFPSSEEAIAFELAVLDYRHPDRNLYAYKLEGVDRTWIQAGNRRYVAYSNLAPGTYVFRARGSNDSGVWSTSDLVLTIVIQPRFWQTWWFRGFILLSVVGAAYALYRYRLSKLLELQRLRLQIADDLHDDIGSELSGIALESDLIARQLPTGTQGRLLTLGQSVRMAADDLRDVVWFVNPDRDRFTDLLTRMQSVAAKLLAGHRYTFTLPEHAQPYPLGMELKRHVLMIFKEILNNVVRHAGASEVEIRIELDRRQVRLTVHDNGRGFDPRQEFTGRGLDSLRSRTGAIGGKIEIQSAPGVGTTVCLEADITRSDD